MMSTTSAFVVSPWAIVALRASAIGMSSMILISPLSNALCGFGAVLSVTSTMPLRFSATKFSTLSIGNSTAPPAGLSYGW